MRLIPIEDKYLKFMVMLNKKMFNMRILNIHSIRHQKQRKLLMKKKKRIEQVLPIVLSRQLKAI